VSPPPPYELRDMATGKVATGPNGERWEGMDIPPGNKMELYDTSATGGAPWQRVSPSEIVRPPDGGTPPPIEPPVEPPIEPPVIPPVIPPTGAGMDFPTTEAQLRECLLGYAASNYVGMLDPRTNVEISSPIVIQAPGSGVPWGVNGNYAKITYRGSGDDLLRIEGTQGVNNRGLTLRNLVLDGGDGGNMSGGGAAACVRVTAPLGDNGPIYRFGIMDVFTSGSVNGLILEGGVYEGELRGLYCENHTGDGIILRHLPASDTAKGPVVSNVLMWHVNSSRNYGAGLRTVYSVYLFGGSFILNGGGGVVAPDGIRGAYGCNGENTGSPSANAVFEVPWGGYGSVIHGGEASSDGQTRCRKWTGSAWEDVGGPLLHYIACSDDVIVTDAHVSYYGSGSNPMTVKK
jgi:hypothetical protein